MPVEVILPKVDMDMERGTIVAWHVKPGEKVAKSAPLFDIETDKAAMEVESPADGTLHHVIAEEGTEVAIGAAVAWIYAEGEEVGDPPEIAAKDEPENPPKPDPKRQTPATPPQPTQDATDTIRATPAARALAAQGGVELREVDGTGPRGRIQADDIRARLDRRQDPVETPAPAGWTPQDGDLRVMKTGSGTATPILMLHGFAADSASLSTLDPLLPQDRQILKIDLPGHGRSPRRRITDFADLVSQIRTRFDALDLDQVHLVGHSLGGALALALADTRPRKIRSLSLLSPAGFGPEFGGEILGGITRASTAASLGPWLKQLTADPDTITGDYIKAATAIRSDAKMRAAQSDMARALFPDDTQGFDVTGALRRITCPTRIIWGREDRIIPWRHALRAPGRVALHLLEDVGHLPHLETLDQVADIISKHVYGSERS